MTIYPDTTFWIALRIPHDCHHDLAKKCFARHEQEVWFWSPWHRLEVYNAIRQLTRGESAVLKEDEARKLIHRFDADVRAEYYLHCEMDWRDVMRTAQEISAELSWTLPCRAADLLHVAYAREFSADLFISLDEDQLSVAQAAGLTASRP